MLIWVLGVWVTPGFCDLLFGVSVVFVWFVRGLVGCLVLFVLRIWVWFRLGVLIGLVILCWWFIAVFWSHFCVGWVLLG